MNKSFADCSKCLLNNQKQSVCLTNCSSDLSKVEVLYITDIISNQKDVEEYAKRKKEDYLVTSIILCDPGKFEQKGIDDICITNVRKFFDLCKPKRIVTVGKLANSWYRNSEQYENHYMLIGQPKTDQELIDDIVLNLNEFQSPKNEIVRESSKVETISTDDKKYSYTVPEKFYTSDYRLVDVQYVSSREQIIYIFRDKDNKKIYFEPPKKHANYYWYESNGNRIIENLDNLQLVIGSYKERNQGPKCYESDVKLEVKHCVDYYLQSKDEPPLIKKNIFFFDIEVYTFKDRIFPVPDKANYPLSAISFSFDDGPIHTYLYNLTGEIDARISDIIKNKKYPNLTIFSDEKTMIKSFCTKMREYDPDFLCGWNCVKAGSFIFTNDRIKTIDIIDENDEIRDFGKVIKKSEKNQKKIFTCTTKKYGYSIDTSGDHIVPVYTKYKNKHSLLKILDTRQDVKVSDISDIMKEKNVFIEVLLKKNTNNRIIKYRDILVEFFDVYFSFDHFDFIVNDYEFRKRLKDTYYTKSSFSRPEYYHGRGYYENRSKKYWSAKKLYSSGVISKEELISFILSKKIVYFVDGTVFPVDIDKIIDNDDLYLLGSIFTDGFYSRSNSSQGYSFCNTNKSYFDKFVDICKIKKYSASKKDILPSERDQCYYFGIGKNSSMMLLLPLIYNNQYKKEINTEILSLFSTLQFSSFVSGLLDGDGSIYTASGGQIFISNSFENHTKRIKMLLLYNGIFCGSYEGGGIIIPNIQNNTFFLKMLKLNHDKKKFNLQSIVNTPYEVLNSSAKIVNKIFFDDRILLELSDVVESDDYYDTYDIETEQHYFSCDGITVHNCEHFDLPYIVTRMKKLGIPMSYLSPYDNVYADYKSGRIILTGYVVLDQLKLYQNLTYINEPSYKLDSIAQKVVGESKKRYDGNLMTLFCDDVSTFIEYSIQDVSLLVKMEDKLQHVLLQDELRKFATTTHAAALSTIGLADGLFITSMKKKGLVSKNGGSPEKEDLDGAYVFNPRGGLFSGLLCDFDFTSLYPSIVNSWNIGPNTLFAKIEKDIAYSYIYNKEELAGKKFKLFEDPIHSSSVREIDINELDLICDQNSATVNITGCLFRGHDKEESIYYSIIEFLFKNRKKYKNIMFEYKQKKDEINTRIFDGKQQALKILMNSLYGVLANEHFRFYNNNLASSITLSGQELLKFSSVHCNRYLKGETGWDIDFAITVEKPLEYVIYGDTDSMFVDLTEYLRKKKINPVPSDEVNAEIKSIQNYLNKDLLKRFAEKHRLPLDKSMLELKNEYLFSRYYSLNVKKKYATQVIAQEGRVLKFIDIKGLEIKRSDIPKQSQEMLQNIVEMIFSDDLSIVKIQTYIDKMLNEFADKAAMGDPSVVKSVSFSKPLSEYKSLPQHIKAMSMWNALVNDDFRHGSRGFLFKIRGIDLNKAPDFVKKNYAEKFLKKYQPSDLDVIVIPEEMDRLPEYFVPDVKEITRFAVTDRTDLMLEPLIKKTQELLSF